VSWIDAGVGCSQYRTDYTSHWMEPATLAVSPPMRRQLAAPRHLLDRPVCRRCAPPSPAPRPLVVDRQKRSDPRITVSPPTIFDDNIAFKSACDLYSRAASSPTATPKRFCTARRIDGAQARLSPYNWLWRLSADDQEMTAHHIGDNSLPRRPPEGPRGPSVGRIGGFRLCSRTRRVGFRHCVDAYHFIATMSFYFFLLFGSPPNCSSIRCSRCLHRGRPDSHRHVPGRSFIDAFFFIKRLSQPWALATLVPHAVGKVNSPPSRSSRRRSLTAVRDRSFIRFSKPKGQIAMAERPWWRITMSHPP